MIALNVAYKMAVFRFGLYSLSSAALRMQLGCVIIAEGMKNEIAWVEENSSPVTSSALI